MKQKKQPYKESRKREKKEENQNNIQEKSGTKENMIKM